MTATQFELDAVKHVANATPDRRLSISAHDLSQIIQRAEVAEARAEAVEKDNADLRGMLRDELLRIEAAEDALAQAEQERDTAWAEIRQIREIISADKDEATSDEVLRKFGNLRKDIHDAYSERDELRRQLDQAHKAIDNLMSPRDDYPYEGDEMDALQREATTS